MVANCVWQGCFAPARLLDRSPGLQGIPPDTCSMCLAQAPPPPDPTTWIETRAHVDSSVIAPVTVVAMLVIRTVLVEVRQPGSARREWSFLSNRCAMAAGAATASLVSIGGWQAAGFAATAWAVLAGALTAHIVDLRTGPADVRREDSNDTHR